MTITYPIDFPTDQGLTDSVLRARNAVSLNESPFSFGQQAYQWSGQRWELEISLPLMTRETAEIYYSFLTKLKGRFGTFTCYVPSAKTPRGIYDPTETYYLTDESGNRLTDESGNRLTLAFGSIHVNGAGQTGNTLNVSGFLGSTNNVLKEGDYFQLGSGATTRLYKILNNVNSDSSGNATLDIYPNLRTSPNNLEVLVLDNPKGLFRLVSNEFNMQSDYRNLFSLSFSAIEVL